MPLSAPQLATEITVAMGFPLPASSQLLGFATGFVNGLKAGSAAGPTISGLSGPAIASAIAAAAPYPGVSGPLAGFGSAFASYMMASAVVVYAAPLPQLGGVITGLSGASFAAAIAGDAGLGSVSAPLLAFGTAVTSHIMANATVNAGVIL